MPVDRELGDERSEPIDRLVIALRAYVTRAPKKPKAGAKDKKYETRGGRVGDWSKYPPRVPPSDWVLVFDCETGTTPDQRLRFSSASYVDQRGPIKRRNGFRGEMPIRNRCDSRRL